jgi:hypothetical protein
MFAKLAVIVLTLGAVGAALLGMRQSRLLASHDLAATQLRIQRHDEELWRLRTQIASRITPGQIEALAASQGVLRAYGSEPQSKPGTADDPAAPKHKPSPRPEHE